MQHVGLGGMYPEFHDFLLVKVMKDTILYQFQDNIKKNLQKIKYIEIFL